MNRKLATVLNWLDALRTRQEFPKFSYSITADPSGRPSLEIQHLKVWVYHDQRRYWIAQGLDIGYVASANDIETLQERFMRGLAMTMIVNRERHGSIDAIAKPAPPEVWLAWRRCVRAMNPPPPKQVVSAPPDVVPGLQAPAPKLALSFYCPAC